MKSFRFLAISTRGFASKPVVDWTRPGNVLSLEQKQFYKKNGFLLVRNCVAREDLKKYEDRFNAICERKVKPPASMLVMKDVSIAKKVTPDSEFGSVVFETLKPTDGFQRLTFLPKAENQKFSADSYRSGARNSVTTKPFTVSTGHTTSERNSTDRKTKRKKNNQEQLLDWTVV
ncbi:hypothetical protein L3Y34_002901 [Caenorhabditis briggsae]|uniref:phytanoyl-CoA dioxygenase n=1 Tax=Caenorhabditis briggsae TaxID=6238 RepID=A0AAE9A930_CAEBR|nr:hypothetical protein L3Y34_002901 [Caenorhabditis briggsae]